MNIPPRIAATIIGTLIASGASAQTTSINSGSLGAAGNGTNTVDAILGLPGAVSAGGDTAVGYAGGARTTVPFNSALNPAASSPFTIEFWAMPTASDNDDAPMVNRIATGNRSGWVFFQRAAGTGWNFRMYNGNGSTLGWDLTGGTSTLNAWSHVVATWDGSASILYVNGALADDTNTAGLNGIYNVSTSAIFSVGAQDNGLSPTTGSVDEVAFYSSVLSPLQILSHYTTASSHVPGAYSTLVINDGAVEYLQGVPEPGSLGLIVAGSVLVGARRRRAA